MFGLKTKSEKRIDALEKELYFRPAQIITTRGNVIAMGAAQIIDEGMPAEFAKQAIARKLVDEAIKFIHYDLESHDDGKNVLKGYIQVVTYGTEVNK